MGKPVYSTASVIVFGLSGPNTLGKVRPSGGPWISFGTGSRLWVGLQGLPASLLLAQLLVAGLVVPARKGLEAQTLAERVVVLRHSGRGAIYCLAGHTQIPQGSGRLSSFLIRWQFSVLLDVW